MKSWNSRILQGLGVATAIAVPVLTNGCSAANSIQQAVCCTEYKSGTDMAGVDFKVDTSISGQFHAFAQASGDMAVVANASVNDVTGACRNMALDLGVDPKDPAVVMATTGTTAKTGTDLMSFWCGQAGAKIDAVFSAAGMIKGSLALTVTGGECHVSIQAQASCQANCDVNAMCDIKATPPTCKGGTLDIDCKGDCTVSAQAPSIDCEGTCMGNCSGSCQADVMGGSVDCVGKCDGTCTAKAGVGNGTGAQSDGSCQGSCSGRCTFTDPSAKVACMGTCSGKCDATCKASPGMASVKCSGTCSADYQPIECKGGTLEGGCNVNAKCQANCNASASARAECTPPSIKIVLMTNVSAQFQGQVDALINTLEVNLPALWTVFKVRGQAFLDALTVVVDGGVDITASGKLDAHGIGCMTIIGNDVQTASVNFGGALSASGNIVGKVSQ